MLSPRVRFEPLGEQHKQLRAAFACGVDSLDRYLQQRARQEMRRGVVVVRVLRDVENDAIGGYYTLSAASVVPADVPDELVRRLPRYPALPALLIGRLATDTRYRGRGFGGMLLFDGFRRALEISRSVGAVAILVDGLDDAASRFYERYGFQRLALHERRLYIPTATVARAVERTMARTVPNREHLHMSEDPREEYIR